MSYPIPVAWSNIMAGPVKRTRLAGRMTLIGVILTLVGALCISSPFLLLVAYRPHVSASTSVTSNENTAQLRAAAKWDKNLLHTPQLAVGQASDPFSTSSQPAYMTDTAYQGLLGSGDMMATISIPKIGVNLNVGHGTGSGTLATGAGHVYGTTLPVGDPGNSVIAGHRGLGLSLLFYRLGELQSGDMVYTRAAGRTVAWQVTRITRVTPGTAKERALLKADGKHTLLTLYTCDPPGLNTRRLVITCKRVPYVDPVSVPGQVDWRHAGLMGGVTAVAAAIFYPLFRPVGFPVRHARRRRD
ncbi:sortase [Bifidobacterium porcinum]|uniref:sortase n=1 Tax=Bifidobacterium porcinum TaxID=212365 RepID=UPI0039964C02